MIYITLRGGLGNQMFQFAAGQVLGQFFNQRVYYNRFYIYKEPFYKNHIDSLKFLKASDDIKFMSKPSEAFVSMINLIKARQVKSKYCEKSNFPSDRLLDAMVAKGAMIFSNVYRYYWPKRINHSLFCDCFFQNTKYINKCSREIIDNLYVNESYRPNDKNIRMLDQIIHSNSVCFHIRRGDYINTKWSKGLLVCDKQYYEAAYLFAKSQLNSPQFFIFTNTHSDIQWIKNNYCFGRDVIYVDLGNCDYKELFLMYHCKNFILSNSSFSWWAQELAKQKKLVIAPNKWCNSNEDTSGIYGPGWKII